MEVVAGKYHTGHLFYNSNIQRLTLCSLTRTKIWLASILQVPQEEIGKLIQCHTTVLGNTCFPANVFNSNWQNTLNQIWFIFRNILFAIHICKLKMEKHVFSSLNVGNLQGKKNNGTQILNVTGLTKPTNFSGEIKLLSKSRFMLNKIKDILRWET